MVFFPADTHLLFVIVTLGKSRIFRRGVGLGMLRPDIEGCTDLPRKAIGPKESNCFRGGRTVVTSCTYTMCVTRQTTI